jgi:hypothetical protein
MKLSFSSRGDTGSYIRENVRGGFGSPLRMDPPDDEPPSLKIESMDEYNPPEAHYPDPDTPAVDSVADAQGFFNVEQSLGVDTNRHMGGLDLFPHHYVSPESVSPSHEQYFHEPPTHYEEDYYQETPLHDNGEYYKADESIPRNDEYDGEDPDSPRDQYHDGGASSKNRQYFASDPSPVNHEYFEGGRPAHSNGQFYEEGPSPSSSRYYEDAPTHYEDAQSYQENGLLEPDGDEQVEARHFPHVNADYGAPKPASANDEYNGTDEKKFGLEKDDRDSHSHIENSAEFVGQDALPDRYIDTSSNPYSPMGTSVNSGGGLDSTKSHQSSAMRGAHEILKRNRRRRLDV